jgi:xylose isomerase
MRTYLILAEKARRFAEDADIQEALRAARLPDLATPTSPDGTTREAIDALRRADIDEDALATQGYGHERLDQLVTELLLGVR